jgi:hypothetical protein
MPGLVPGVVVLSSATLQRGPPNSSCWTRLGGFMQT